MNEFIVMIYGAIYCTIQSFTDQIHPKTYIKCQKSFGGLSCLRKEIITIKSEYLIMTLITIAINVYLAFRLALHCQLLVIYLN